MFTRYFFSAPLAAGLPDATGAGRNDQVGAVPAVVVPANPEAGVRTEGGQEQQLQNCPQHPRTEISQRFSSPPIGELIFETRFIYCNFISAKPFPRQQCWELFAVFEEPSSPFSFKETMNSQFNITWNESYKKPIGAAVSRLTHFSSHTTKWGTFINSDILQTLLQMLD